MACEPGTLAASSLPLKGGTQSRAILSQGICHTAGRTLVRPSLLPAPKAKPGSLAKRTRRLGALTLHSSSAHCLFSMERWPRGLVWALFTLWIWEL